MKRVGIISLLAVTLLLVACGNGSKLRLITEENTPFNFTQDGKLTGMAVEVVQHLQEMLGDKTKIASMPWDKGYELAQSEQNVILFTTTLTEDRKNLFQWVGPIAIVDYTLYGRPAVGYNFRVLDDAKAVQTIVAPKGYAVVEMLRKAGFTNIQETGTSEEAINMVLAGNADLYAGPNLAYFSLMKQMGKQPGALTPAFVFETQMMYMAFSKGIPAETVAAWQKALDDSKRDESFQKIYRKWFPLENPPQILQMYTEDYPPLTFEQDGRVTGLGTEIVREICRRLNTPENIRLLQWDNAYKLALLNPNTVLFTVEHTLERDPLFQWVGPLGSNITQFYTRKGDKLKIESMDDAKKVEKIATCSSWFTEQELRRAGFTNLVSSPYPEENVRQLMQGEAQLSVFTDLTVPDLARMAGYSVEDLQPVYVVSESYFYIALSQGTPPETVQAWKEAYTQMKQDGTLAQIYAKWLPNRQPPQEVTDETSAPANADGAAAAGGVQ